MGFQNIVGCEVLQCLDGVEGTRGLCPWVREFVSPRSFEVSWDGSVRGTGRLVVGVPQGSPLLPVLFLVWLAPILVKMEQRIRDEVPGVVVEFPPYVDDLHCGLYHERASSRRLGEVERRERMEDLVGHVSVVLKKVSAEWVSLWLRTRRSVGFFGVVGVAVGGGEFARR